MSTELFDPVKVQSKVTDSVIVAFSCGKESIVTLDLCCRYFKNVKAFYLYVVPQVSFIEKVLQWYENKYNIEIIRLPHMDVGCFFRYGSFRRPDPTFPIVSMNDVYQYVRLETDIWWIAAGERIKDSIVRRAMIKKSSSIDVQRGRFYPVANFSKKDIYDYIKYHKLYLGEYNKIAGHSFGGLEWAELEIIRDRFPSDWEKFKNLYPFVEAALKRHEAYGEK